MICNQSLRNTYLLAELRGIWRRHFCFAFHARYHVCCCCFQLCLYVQILLHFFFTKWSVTTRKSRSYDMFYIHILISHIHTYIHTLWVASCGPIEQPVSLHSGRNSVRVYKLFLNFFFVVLYLHTFLECSGFFICMYVMSFVWIILWNNATD